MQEEEDLVREEGHRLSQRHRSVQRAEEQRLVAQRNRYADEKVQLKSKSLHNWNLQFKKNFSWLCWSRAKRKSNSFFQLFRHITPWLIGWLVDVFLLFNQVSGRLIDWFKTCLFVINRSINWPLIWLNVRSKKNSSKKNCLSRSSSQKRRLEERAICDEDAERIADEVKILAFAKQYLESIMPSVYVRLHEEDYFENAVRKGKKFSPREKWKMKCA